MSKGEKTIGKFDKYGKYLGPLLEKRGFEDDTAVEKFLNPKYEGMHDPFLMKDMDKAVEMVLEAVRDNQKITVWSDYDADGLPGAALMDDFFTQIGFSNFEIYIPHRTTEGFGLNTEAVKEIAKNGTKLLITIDCGITDTEEIDLAKSLGMKIILSDHHLPKEILPKADAILNPKQPSCEYPDKELCGSGVAWKFIQGILAKNRFGIADGQEKWFLDLVGIATLSDMVPLIGENRILAHFGLKVLNRTRRPGLLSLFSINRLRSGYITEDDVVFTITPRINAASRMGNADKALRVLISKNGESEMYARELEKINAERKGYVAGIVKEARKHLESLDKIDDVIVFGNPNWKPGILGLAAQSLVKDYGRPVFLWGKEDSEHIKGSCRSEGITNVFDLMNLAEENVLDHFGGHKFSGGFGLLVENVFKLEKVLLDAHKKLEKKSADTITVDLKIDSKEISQNILNEINKLAPFGVGNPKPTFEIQNETVISKRIFGKAKDHLEVVFGEPYSKSAISFFGAGMIEKIGDKVSMLGCIEKDSFKNSVRFRINEIL